MQGSLPKDDVGSEIQMIRVEHIPRTECSSPLGYYQVLSITSVDSTKSAAREFCMIQQAFRLLPRMDPERNSIVR